MAETDWSYLNDGLDIATVHRGVTAGIARPPGGGSFLFAFNSLAAVTGAVGLFANLTNYAPMAKGGSIRGVLQRGAGGGPTGFSPFLFLCSGVMTLTAFTSRLGSGQGRIQTAKATAGEVQAREWLAVVREEAEGARLILQCLSTITQPDGIGARSGRGAPLRFALRLLGLRGLRARHRRGRPFPEDPPVQAGAAHLDREQAAWVRRLVEPTTRDAGDHGFEPGVMVTEEAEPRLRSGKELVEPGSLADVACAASVSLEGHPGWRVVGEYDVEPATAGERGDLVARVVPLRVPLEGRRWTFEIRGAEAPADAADAEDVVASAQLLDLTVAQVQEVR
jgi:hypothetical protein